MSLTYMAHNNTLLCWQPRLSIPNATLKDDFNRRRQGQVRDSSADGAVKNAGGLLQSMVGVAAPGNLHRH